MSDKDKIDISTDVVSKLRSMLEDGYVGKFNDANARQAIKKCIEEQLSKLPVESCDLVRCDTLWNSMSLKDKVKWYAYNVFPLKNVGSLQRRVIDLTYEVAVLERELDFKEEDGELYINPGMEYPRYLEPSPKSKILVSSVVRLSCPIDFIPISVNINDLKKSYV